MPFLVTSSESAIESLDKAVTELVPRNCRLAEYDKIKVPTFKVKGALIAYASPDSTYAVTKELLDGAKQSIIIGIYDLSAGYMKDILLNAMQRGVELSLMLDIDGNAEQKMFDELAKFGCNAVPAPSCASESANVFPSSHEKVIVIDGEWTLIQSGNYSKNSIPLNEVDGGDVDSFVKGNRDMGIAIQSAPLAKFFADVLKADMKLQLDAEGLQAAAKHKPEPDLVEFVPEALPAKLFKSKRFTPSTPVLIEPVLTPDNYMELVPRFLESAKSSIFIEQQYIRGAHDEIRTLLQAIADARGGNSELDIRIILGKPFSATDVEKEKKNLALLRKDFQLKLGEHIRFINVDRFVHCHNKLIVVDNNAALISSQNWSRTGVGTNREAGVILRLPAAARYYAEIFESDWATALKKIPIPKKKETVLPETLSRGGFVEVVAADYQEV